MGEELRELTKAELMKRAAKFKIRVAPSMAKDEIVSALKKAGTKSVKPAQASGKTVKKQATAPAKPVAVKKPVAVAKPVATPAKLVAVKKPAPAAKPVATPAKLVAVKKPAPAAKPAATPAKLVAVKKPVAVAKPVAKPAAKTKETKPVKSAVVLPVKSKAEPARAVAVKESKEETKEKKTATRKPPVVESKAVSAGVEDKTGKRPARSRIPASPTPPLYAGKEPSLAPAVSTQSVSAIAVNNGKRSWDIKIDEKKFFIADEKYDYAQAAQPKLPDRYGDMRLIALARDPFKLYIYWELDGGGVERARAELGCDWPLIRWAMRVFDVTGVEFDGANANRYFDVDVNPYLGCVYLDVDRANCEYTVAMGLKDEGGRFEPVVVSNKVRTPRSEPSARTDADWSVPEDLFVRIYGISGGYTAASGSLESSRLSLPFGEVSSAAVSSFGAVSSFAISSFGASEQMARGKQRKFFFWLDCELIVYGGTEPDATVSMMGKKINLRPDGTFTARFNLPDGVYDIPVTANSSDGVESREISPTVTRITRRKQEFLIPENEWLKK